MSFHLRWVTPRVRAPFAMRVASVHWGDSRLEERCVGKGRPLDKKRSTTDPSPIFYDTLYQKCCFDFVSNWNLTKQSMLATFIYCTLVACLSTPLLSIKEWIMNSSCLRRRQPVKPWMTPRRVFQKVTAVFLNL